MTPEEFKNLLAYVGLKTFFDGKVDFDISELDKIISNYCSKNNVDLKTSDVIFDATRNACMMVQEGVSLKFSHRSFQEYFAAVGINQLDDKLQKQILIQWSQADRNNITAHKTFMNALFTIQNERTYKNLCIPLIEIMEKKYKEIKDIDDRVSKCFKDFICVEDGKENKKELRFLLKNDENFYFNLQFLIFSDLNIDILKIDNHEMIENLESKIIFDWKPDERRNYSEISTEKKILINDWVDGWYFARHRYLMNWSAEFIKKTTTKKRSLQNIMASI